MVMRGKVSDEGRFSKPDHLMVTHQMIWLTKAVILSAPLVVLFIRAIQEVLKTLSPNLARDVRVILGYTAIAILLALYIGFFSEQIWQKAKRLFSYALPFSPWLNARVDRLKRNADHLPRSAALFLRIIYLALASSVMYFIGMQTDAWHLVRSWSGGPQVDLTLNLPDKTFQPIVNLPWFNYGQDFGQVSGWEWSGVSKRRAIIEDSFKRLSESDIKCLLWFSLFDGRSSPKFDANGYVTGLDSSFWQDYDTAIELARKYKLAIIWVLLDYTWMLPAKSEADASIFGHADVIAQRDQRESFFKNALIPILDRYPYESQIAGWILINEPENALKEGLASSESIREFTHEAAQLIKEHTYRQPVSVGCADLESMLEYWGKDFSDFDFLVFHQYEQHLPPPVSHIRELAPLAANKPIYVGEFDLNKPPLELNKLAVWLRHLGYAGLWPWSINDGAGSPHYGDAQLLSNSVAVANEQSSALREQFENRCQLDMSSLPEDFRQEADWWNLYWPKTVMPIVNRNIDQWHEGSRLHEKEYEVNLDWENRTLRLLDELASEKKAKERELKQANDSFTENQKLQKISGINESRAWIERIEAHLQKIDSTRVEQEGYLKLARERSALHRSQATWNRYKSKWAQLLYLSYWEDEQRNNSQ